MPLPPQLHRKLWLRSTPRPCQPRCLSAFNFYVSSCSAAFGFCEPHGLLVLAARQPSTYTALAASKLPATADPTTLGAPLVLIPRTKQPQLHHSLWIRVTQPTSRSRVWSTFGLYSPTCTAIFGSGRPHGPDDHNGCESLASNTQLYRRLCRLATPCPFRPRCYSTYQPTAQASRQPPV